MSSLAPPEERGDDVAVPETLPAMVAEHSVQVLRLREVAAVTDSCRMHGGSRVQE